MLTARRTEAALELLEPASTEFADLQPSPDAVAIDGQLARAFYFLQQYRRALELADRTLEAAEHEDLIPIIADTLVTKASALAAMGRAREAMGVIRSGEQLAREYGLSATLLRALNNRSVMEDMFDPRSSMEAVREGLALARRTGERGWVFGLQIGMGYGSYLVGDWDAALSISVPALPMIRGPLVPHPAAREPHQHPGVARRGRRRPAGRTGDPREGDGRPRAGRKGP